MQTRLNLLLCLCLLTLSMPASGFNELTPEQLEQWFEDDERDHPYETSSNDGDLVFLPSAPARPTLHSSNILTIEPHSLQSGWVNVEQCYRRLDPITKVEVVYRYKQMRGLRITQTSSIGKARVEGQSIQLEDVARHASLCMQAQARILYRQQDGSWLLRNGPFQRRFLDGYFPMQVTLTVSYPDELLSLQQVSPAAANGFEVQAEPGRIHINTWFEGKLMIELAFSGRVK